MNLTQDYVRSLFVYDFDKGLLFWRENKGTTGKAGREAGYTSNGYRSVKIDSRGYLTHRLIWLYVHGCEPNEHIDHIDGDRSNNRMDNLREASNTMNMENQTKPLKNNRSGYLGVSYRKDRDNYRAQIWVGTKRIHLGNYSDAKSAHEAYLKAKRELHAGCVS